MFDYEEFFKGFTKVYKENLDANLGKVNKEKKRNRSKFLEK